MREYEARVAEEGELDEEELPEEVLDQVEGAQGAKQRAHFAVRLPLRLMRKAE
jgi:hypothetical protein